MPVVNVRKGDDICRYAVIMVIVLISCSGCMAPAEPAPGPEKPDLVQNDPARQLAEQYPAPGDLVVVNGSVMHIRCQGTGSPVVILEAGSTDCSLSWARVQPAVSRFTTVCSYDRAGYGWSEPQEGALTARAVTSRLHQLLSRANISPPYILAGHSLGGEYARAYAHWYPDEVAGLVLVDPGSEWQMVRTGEKFTREQKAATAAAVRMIRDDQELAENGTFVRNLTRVPVDPRLPHDEFMAYRALLATRPSFWEARAVEGESAFSIFEELQRENITDLGDIPLIVISSGNEMGFSPDPQQNAEANRIFRMLQEETARQSSSGQYLMAPETSHYVQLDRPDMVISAVRTVFNESRERIGG